MEDNKIAVLIDGENISQNDIDYIFTEIKKDGQILISRLYSGVDRLAKWKEACNEYSIKIMTQNNFVSGKNTTDSSLIIDAMDILYTKKIDTFYILSSDSDFTGIIMRLKEENKRVIGVGKKKTPKPIVNACNKFIFIENLRPQKEEKKIIEKPKEKSVTNLNDIIKEIFELLNEGKIQVSRIKEKIINLHPEFDLRNYKKNMKFSKFLETIPNVEITLDNDGTTLFASLKEINNNEIVDAKKEEKKNKSKEKQIKKEKKTIEDKNIIIPSLDEIRNFITNLINISYENKINLGQLYATIKKEYPSFLLKNYKVKSIRKFIGLYDNYFKYDNDDMPNFLLLNEDYDDLDDYDDLPF